MNIMDFGFLVNKISIFIFYFFSTGVTQIHRHKTNDFIRYFTKIHRQYASWSIIRLRWMSSMQNILLKFRIIFKLKKGADIDYSIMIQTDYMLRWFLFGTAIWRKMDFVSSHFSPFKKRRSYRNCSMSYMDIFSRHGL